MAFGRAKKPREPLEEPALLDYAVKSLASKMKSERDLRKRLVERVAPDDEGTNAVANVLAKLKEFGYLSDERFAADYTRLRQENEKFGRRRVQQGLMQKGIAAPLVSEAVGKQYDELDEVALAREYVARKRMKPPSGGPANDREQKQKETARAMRRLVAAGFSTRAVWGVLRGWGAGIEEVDVADAETAAEDV